MRKKLIELLSAVSCNGNGESLGSCPDRKCGLCREVDKLSYCVIQNTANHLLANGVTIQQWIPVTERLPEEGEYVLCVLKGFNYGGKIQVCKFVPADKFKDKPYFEHFRNGFPSVTHWMPLPEPPEED